MTFKVTQLIKPMYRNFEAFRRDKVDRCSRRRDGTKPEYPCSNCDGSGRVRRFEDRDPIEGYKLAPTYVCEVCHGSGDVGLSTLRQQYRDYLHDIETQNIPLRFRRAKELAALRQAKKFLARHELQTLGLI